MRAMFLLDLLENLGVGQQVVLALSVGFVVWYLYRAIGLGRKVGGFVGQGLRYLMAVAAFAAIGIAFGWVNPSTIGTDLAAAWAELGAMASEFGDDIWQWIVEVIG